MSWAVRPAEYGQCQMAVMFMLGPPWTVLKYTVMMTTVINMINDTDDGGHDDGARGVVILMLLVLLLPFLLLLNLPVTSPQPRKQITATEKLLPLPPFQHC